MEGALYNAQFQLMVVTLMMQPIQKHLYLHMYMQYNPIKDKNGHSSITDFVYIHLNNLLL